MDSQELWIAAVLGDAYFAKEHGCTALGWMTLQGNKAEGTDMHSVTAKNAGVSRDEAKILNYARIYGAGSKFASTLLLNFKPSLGEQEAMRRAVNMMKKTKGEKEHYLNDLGKLCYRIKHDHDPPASVDIGELNKCAKVDKVLKEIFEPINPSNVEFKLKDGFDIEDFNGTIEMVRKIVQDTLKDRKYVDKVKEDIYEKRKSAEKLCSKTCWNNGSESYTFNHLEKLATSWKAKTPVLGCAISEALTSEIVGSDYLPSRVNWVVQSSAVDYLHLLLSAMKWMINEYNIEARFAISIHDEVRYLVAAEDLYRAALALQIANLLVRAMFCKQLGMNSMPLDVAFFSGVDIDRVMRKEPSADCVTPSNPLGLTRGYGVPVGECLNMKDILEKTNGKLKKRAS